MEDINWGELEKSSAPKVDTTALKDISSLAQQQLDMELEIAAREQDLKDLKQQHESLVTKTIPDAMEDAGVSEFKLNNGKKVTIKELFQASIPRDKKPEALDWLKDNGHGALIRHDVSMSFGKGEENTVSTLLTILKENGYSAKDEQNVHWKTLTSFAKEQIEKGASIPADLLGVFIGRKSIIGD